MASRRALSVGAAAPPAPEVQATPERAQGQSQGAAVAGAGDELTPVSAPWVMPYLNAAARVSAASTAVSGIAVLAARSQTSADPARSQKTPVFDAASYAEFDAAVEAPERHFEAPGSEGARCSISRTGNHSGSTGSRPHSTPTMHASPAQDEVEGKRAQKSVNNGASPVVEGGSETSTEAEGPRSAANDVRPPTKHAASHAPNSAPEPKLVFSYAYASFAAFNSSEASSVPDLPGPFEDESAPLVEPVGARASELPSDSFSQETSVIRDRRVGHYEMFPTATGYPPSDKSPAHSPPPPIPGKPAPAPFSAPKNVATLPPHPPPPPFRGSQPAAQEIAGAFPRTVSHSYSEFSSGDPLVPITIRQTRSSESRGTGPNTAANDRDVRAPDAASDIAPKPAVPELTRYQPFDLGNFPAENTLHGEPVPVPPVYQLFDALDECPSAGTSSNSNYSRFSFSPRACASPAASNTNYAAVPHSITAGDTLYGTADPQAQLGSGSASWIDPTEFENGFDEDFQRYMDILQDEDYYFGSFPIAKLRRLVQDFRHAATTYGRVIIAEKHLPIEKKTVKPIANIGGIAGGTKYMAGNVFFRFPVDFIQLYGSEELAAKEANHQLRGLAALYNASNSGLSLPLLAVIKYRGYKLVAMSVLPIQGAETLCLGSADGGRSLSANDHDQSAAKCIEKAATILNLAYHPVKVNGPNGRQMWLHGPCDMEVHRVKLPNEGVRHYVVDFARLFPPQPPSQLLASLLPSTEMVPQSASVNRFVPNMSASHLVHMLRPEFVRMHSKPLSSDAFTQFAATNRPEFNQDVLEATRFLLQTTIPNLVQKLEVDLRGRTATSKPLEIGNVMHVHGVNMRFLGVMFDHAKSIELKRELLLEATARTVKAMVRAAMRSVQASVRTAVVSPYVEAVLDCINAAVGRTTCSAPTHRCGHSCGCLCDPAAERMLNHPCGASYLQLFSEEQAARLAAGSNVSESELKEEAARRRFWCLRIAKLLRERFLFSLSSIDDGLAQIDRAMCQARGSAVVSCACCNCRWKRAVSPAHLFQRVRRMCGIQLSESAHEVVEESIKCSNSRSVCRQPVFLRRQDSMSLPTAISFSSSLSSAASASSAFSFPSAGLGLSASDPELAPNSALDVIESCFELLTPFSVHDIVDVVGSSVMLPIMEYAQGIENLYHAKRLFGSGHVKTARRVAENAKECFDKGLKMAPLDAKLMNFRASTLDFQFASFQIGTDADFVQEYIHCAKVNPWYPRSWLECARALYRQLGRSGSRVSFSDKTFRIVIDGLGGMEELGPKLDPTIRFRRATDGTSRALQIIDYLFRRGLEANPQYVHCKKDYANFLQNTLMRTSEAMRLFKEALADQPSNLHCLRSLGKLQFARELWSDALATMQQAFSFYPRDAVVCLDLALAQLTAVEAEDGYVPFFSRSYSKILRDKLKRASKNVAAGLGKMEARVARAAAVSKAKSELAMRPKATNQAPMESEDSSAASEDVRALREKRISLLRESAENTQQAMRLLRAFADQTFEKGHKVMHYFELSDKDMHAATSLRISKSFLKVARLSFAIVDRLRQVQLAPEKHADQMSRELLDEDTIRCLETNAWTSFEWAAHVVEKDPLFLKYVEETGETKPPSKAFTQRNKTETFHHNRVSQLFKQAAVVYMHHGQCLARKIDPSLDFAARMSVRLRNFAGVAAEHSRREEVSKSFEDNAVLALAHRLLQRAVELDGRDESGPEATLVHFLLHFSVDAAFQKAADVALDADFER